MPFHISPRNGAIRECKADVRPCPYGQEFHATDKDAAKTNRDAMIANLPPVLRGGIDKVLRPRGSSISGFMGMFETYDAVVTDDMAYLHTRGVFPEELGDMVTKLIRSTMVPEYQDKELYAAIASHVASDVKVEVYISPYLGHQSCPWQGRPSDGCAGGRSGRNVRISSPRGTVQTNELMAHLITAHKFFQGKHSEYRVDPARLLDVLGWH